MKEQAASLPSRISTLLSGGLRSDRGPGIGVGRRHPARQVCHPLRQPGPPQNLHLRPLPQHQRRQPSGEAVAEAHHQRAVCFAARLLVLERGSQAAGGVPAQAQLDFDQGETIDERAIAAYFRTSKSGGNSNQVRGRKWDEFRTSIDEVEAATGYDFLTSVPADIQAVIESQRPPPPSRSEEVVGLSRPD